MTELLSACTFPELARQRVGYALGQVQLGLEPPDWRPMPSLALQHVIFGWPLVCTSVLVAISGGVLRATRIMLAGAFRIFARSAGAFSWARLQLSFGVGRTEDRGGMSPSAFLDRGSPPAERALAEVLGKGHGLWAELRADLSRDFAPLDGKWSFSGKSHGWILQLRQKQRTVLYMVPCAGYFVASFALGEKACQAAQGSRLPTRVREIIQHAPKYPEGRGVRLEVRKTKDLANVEALASIKMAN